MQLIYVIFLCHTLNVETFIINAKITIFVFTAGNIYGIIIIRVYIRFFSLKNLVFETHRCINTSEKIKLSKSLCRPLSAIITAEFSERMFRCARSRVRSAGSQRDISGRRRLVSDTRRPIW